MRRQFILLLGVFLASHLPAAAQTRPLPVVPAQDMAAAIVAMVPAVPAPSQAALFLLPESPGIPALHFSYGSAGDYSGALDMEGLRNLTQISVVRTLFITEMSLPLVQLWSGRLRFDAFTSALNVQDVQLGPSGAGGLQDSHPWRQGYLGAPRSLDSYGASLTFHFGRNAQIGRPTQIWRRAVRIIRAVR